MTHNVAGVAAIVAAFGVAQRYTPPPADVRPVPLQASCAADAAAEIDRGAAWLLLLAPAQARRAFERAAEADPDCALAYWGQAVSHFPIADEPPTTRALADIRLATERARSVPARTAFERVAVEALTRFVSREAAPGVGAAWPARLAAYRDALCPLAATPDATEPMRLLCARAQMLTSSLPGDRASLDARRLLAGAIGDRAPDATRVTAEASLSAGAAVAILQTADGAASPLVLAALAALATLGAPAPAAHHLALRAAVRLGDWPRATQAGERALGAAGTEGVFSLLLGARPDYAPEWLLEAYLQQGRRAAATTFVADSRAVLSALDAGDLRTQAIRQAISRMAARLAVSTRRWPVRDTRAPGVSAHDRWEDAFVDGLAAALRAWPGGDPARLAQARAARDGLAALAESDRTPSEILWAATVVDAAMAASQDEHPQMALLFTHAIDLEDRLRAAGRLGLPLVPTRELAAELWLRTYRYPDAVREARAALEIAPNRAMPYLVLARTAARLRDTPAAAAAYRRLRELRGTADPDDELGREAAAFLAR